MVQLGTADLSIGVHQGRVTAGATQAHEFREDLQRLPRNGWGLYGLMRSLRAQGRTQEAAEVESEFNEVWAGSDFKLTSPCFCQPRI